MTIALHIKSLLTEVFETKTLFKLPLRERVFYLILLNFKGSSVLKTEANFKTVKIKHEFIFPEKIKIKYCIKRARSNYSYIVF